MKTIAVAPAVLANCFVKARYVADLTREETQGLMNWCDWQDESLWDELNLQEILNVYRVSAEWDTWADWAGEERAAAVRGYNSAVRTAKRLEA